MRGKRNILRYILIFAGAFFLLFRIASEDTDTYKTGHWHSTLFADPAGYYVYLPATFQYSYKGDFLDKADSITGTWKKGDDFRLGPDKQVITKYTYGVALLESPFYLGALAYSKIFGIENTGFSYINQVAVTVAGVFYAVLGLMLLFLFLRNYFSAGISFLSVLIIFWATNTLYYATILPGMSHIYLFFLFNLVLFCYKRFLMEGRRKDLCISLAAYCLIILIRPADILFGIVFLVLDTDSFRELPARIKLLATLKNILLFIGLLLLVYAPQFAYWKYTYGSFLADTYKGETFENKWNPKILEFLFAPHNGLFSYNPIYLLIFILLGVYLKRMRAFFTGIIVMMVLLFYVCSAWYLYFFGCSFGSRNIVEYSGLLAMPLGIWFTRLADQKHKIRIALATVLICIFGYVNLKLMCSYELCFWGNGDWAWREYKYLLWHEKETRVFDPERSQEGKMVWVNNEKAYDLVPSENLSDGISFYQEDFTCGYKKKAFITVDAMSCEAQDSAFLVCNVYEGDSLVLSKKEMVRTSKNGWKGAAIWTPLPWDTEKNQWVRIYIENPWRKHLYFKNLKAVLE